MCLNVYGHIKWHSQQYRCVVQQNITNMRKHSIFSVFFLYKTTTAEYKFALTCLKPTVAVQLRCYDGTIQQARMVCHFALMFVFIYLFFN